MPKTWLLPDGMRLYEQVKARHAELQKDEDERETKRVAVRTQLKEVITSLDAALMEGVLARATGYKMTARTSTRSPRARVRSSRRPTFA